MFAGRAPAAHVALAAYIGGSREPALAREQPDVLIDIARCEFKELLGVTGEPQIARVKQWPMGLPQTSLGHSSKLMAFANAEKALPGLFLTGNYFSGPGITHCVTGAIETAGRVDGLLQSSGTGNSTAGCQQGEQQHSAMNG